MSESMSKIEEVARAIAANNGVIWGGPRGDDDPDFMLVRAMYLEMARAAIEAMRSLLDGDNLAKILHDIDDLRGPMREPNATFRTFWNAAIDAALIEDRE